MTLKKDLVIVDFFDPNSRLRDSLLFAKTGKLYFVDSSDFMYDLQYQFDYGEFAPKL